MVCLIFFNRIDVDSRGRVTRNFGLPNDKINNDTVVANGDKHLDYSCSLIMDCMKFID